jgi:hypothetical protein
MDLELSLMSPKGHLMGKDFSGNPDKTSKELPGGVM